MGKRVTIKMPVGGGMYKAGDAASIPNECSEELKNVFVRPGPRYEKRDGWLRDSTIAGLQPYGLFAYVDPANGTNTLAHSGGCYRDAAGAWQAPSGSGSINTDGDVDFCNMGYGTIGAGANRCVVCGYLSSGTRTMAYFTGTAQTDPTHTVRARCTEGLGRRLFLANTSVSYLNKAGNTIGYGFEDAGNWVLAGGPPTVAKVGERRKVTIVNGGTDTLTSAKVYTTASEVTVSWVQWFLPISATTSTPMRMQIVNTAGTTTYGQQIIEIPTAASSGPNDWVAFYVQAKVPSGVDVSLRLLAGDGARNATNGTTFYVSTDGTSPDTQKYGAHVNEGTYLQGMEAPLATLLSRAQSQRIRWSEVDNADDIRVDSWLDIKDSAGPITAMKAIDRLRLAVYKENAVFTYALTDSVDLPIQREGSWYEVGCVGPKALCVYENVHYFVGPHEVYSFDGSNAPTPLAGDGMREAMFNQDTVAYPICEMDRDNRELYVYVQAGKIHVYNLATKAWSYIDIAGGLNVADLLYCKANGETRREMWAALLDSVNIVRLKSGQTQDNATGSASDVSAEVWFKPIQAEDELQQITLENITLRHKVTASQAASTTVAGVSFDGGATFTYSNTVRIAPLATGGTSPCEVPLWETAPRITVRLVHTGLAGPTYFNLTSATAAVQLQGRASLAGPTEVSSSL